MLRFSLTLSLSLSVGCSGEAPGTHPEPEICDDGIDNNGNGLIDCEDSASCGGLVCRDNTNNTNDTGEPLPELEIFIDPDDCCDFTFSDADCAGKPIGQFTILNRSDEQGTIDVTCDVPGTGISVLEIRMNDNQVLRPFLTDAPMEPTSENTIYLSYDCYALQTFEVGCSAKATLPNDSEELGFSVRAIYSP
ncbi:MAG TPA: hypothetical protein ENK18_09125 [Deltaproteobacteria bacterium]|nr:hypothetical protein [Deltaproteobacteria bacterium]